MHLQLGRWRKGGQLELWILLEPSCSGDDSLPTSRTWTTLHPRDEAIAGPLRRVLRHPHLVRGLHCLRRQWELALDERVEPTGTHGWRCALWRELYLCGGEVGERDGEGEGGGGGGGGGERCGLGRLAGEDEQTSSEEQDVQDHEVEGGLHGGGGDGALVEVVSAVLLFGRGS
jgi:hypothetical protein